MALTTADLKRSIIERDAEICRLRAALYDATDGVSGTLLRDENDRINQKAADALAVVAWWFSGPGDPYCKHEQMDGVCHAFFRSKQAEMIEKVSDTLAELKSQGVIPADPNPF